MLLFMSFMVPYEVVAMQDHLLAAVFHSHLLSAQVLYALTAGVAGYVSAVQYKTMGGTNWVSTPLMT